jgi:hypothetical protein
LGIAVPIFSGNISKTKVAQLELGNNRSKMKNKKEQFIRQRRMN